MRSLAREVEALEAEVAQRGGARRALEKLRNDKADVERRLKGVRDQMRETVGLLEEKQKEQESLRASLRFEHEVRGVHHETILRLRKEANADLSAKTNAEREADATQKRLRRLRDTLGDFLKRAVGLRGPNQPLPSTVVSPEDMGSLLADHIELLHTSTSALDGKVNESQERIDEMDASLRKAAAELKRLAARREHYMAAFDEAATIKREHEQREQMHMRDHQTLQAASSSVGAAGSSPTSSGKGKASREAAALGQSCSLPSISTRSSPAKAVQRPDGEVQADQ